MRESDPTTSDVALAVAMLEEPSLTLEDLCRAVPVSAQWVEERVEAGLLAGIATGELGQWRFDAPALLRARRMMRLERDFDAVPELAALVADLESEIARLRQRLRRAGLV